MSGLSKIVAAKLQLFDLIEPGHERWCAQIKGGDALAIHAAIEAHGGEFRSIEELQRLISLANSRFITCESVEWPSQLDDLPNPPIGLLIKGSGSFRDFAQRAISIVGTRNPSPYGVRVAEDFSASFSESEWVVVSGGAYGIDTCAHQGALAMNGRTIAVLANGFNKNYPAGNQRLFDRITEQGLLVSEVMPDVAALPHRFLTRNRLIAAISKATIVVEAAHRSGSIRTALDAAALHRTVFAIPGQISTPTAEGSHQLIIDRIAELVTSPHDALRLLQSLE